MRRWWRASGLAGSFSKRGLDGFTGRTKLIFSPRECTSHLGFSLGFTRTASARSGTGLVSGTVDALNSAGFLFQRLASMDRSAKIPPCLDPGRLRFGGWCRCRNQDGYPGMTQPNQAPTFAPSVRSSSGRGPFDQHPSHIVRMLLSSRK